MSAIETGSACGRGRVIIVTNSLELLGNGYRNAAIVFDGPGDERARCECQAGEGQDVFIARIQADLDAEGVGTRKSWFIPSLASGGVWGRWGEVIFSPRIFSSFGLIAQ